MAMVLFGVQPLPLHAAPGVQARVLFDFRDGFDVDSVQTQDAQMALTADRSLRVRMGIKARWPGITLKAPKGKWDLSNRLYLAADLYNSGDRSVRIHCRVDNPGANGRENCITERLDLAPGKLQTMIVLLSKTSTRLSGPLELVGMRGAPEAAGKLDPSNVTQLLFYVNRPSSERQFDVSNIRVGGTVKTADSKKFIPFIDEFGQYIHNDWPGKVHSTDDFPRRISSEAKDLKAHPGSPDRNRYGGWTAGPKLEATGFFRVEKHKGKWWLVDPEGRLFWSHGIDCVRARNDTPITDREHYYQSLPAEDSPFAPFYSRGSWAPHGFYKSYKSYKTYDFSRANFLRKYGENWDRAFSDITHCRLKSWGLNTIANWSDSSIYLMRRTPYVATISASARRLEGSEGYWGKFYDVFDPSFRKGLRARMEYAKTRSAGDPWCIGYFVHNELSWGDDVSLAVAALKSPADQPAKKVFVDDLKKKYRTIDALNKSWGTEHASWEALLQSESEPDKEKARNDLAAFYTKTAETYFRTIREEVKRVAPKQLYLGCRFAWVNNRAALAATKFCDVVSYNRYRYSVEDLTLPNDIDLPAIIGEFHFGALDRGMFHTGLRKTLDQNDRAAKYKSYVEGALRNPYIVGTHWFQYKDQATTGRGDGENYQIGFVDICDTPYPEIVAAAREVGYGMYEYRLNE
jgi:hypothetical protein